MPAITELKQVSLDNKLSNFKLTMSFVNEQLLKFQK